jgi:thiol-disulfide isomerase/thioredoxin
MKHVGILTLLTFAFISLAGRVGHAQNQPSVAFQSLAELNAAYKQQATDLDRRKLVDLAALAERSKGPDAEGAYRELFDLAVARNLYDAAEPAARAYLAQSGGESQTHALAAAITLIARADRGEYNQSLEDLQQFLSRRAAAQVTESQRLPAPLLFAVGEAYLQRLIQGGKYDIAIKVCRLAVANRADQEIKSYFQRREARIAMIGKPAPAIEGKDIDGRPVRLADFTGKLVLVDFWATWCPPCVASLPTLRRLASEYKDQGFVILGVNLDELANPPSNQPAARSEDRSGTVRWFLVSQRVGWPNLVGAGAETAAKAYGVEEIPANFLIGRDGTIKHVELNEDTLAKVLAAEMGKSATRP